MSCITNKTKTGQKTKKKPPPRPPPPNFTKFKSKSTYNLNENLIEWSPPNSPRTERNNFGGSVSSSFSSSTSSLASSKKSCEFDILNTKHIWSLNLNSASQKQTNYSANVPFSQTIDNPKFNNIPPLTTEFSENQLNFKHDAPNQSNNLPSVFGPTIIRPQPQKIKFSKEHFEFDPLCLSFPMPSIPPPSPPKDVDNVEIPYGVAVFDFESKEPNDLSFQVNDIILLTKKLDNGWYYGKTQDKEGIFPANFINVVVPLHEHDNTVIALYEFPAQMPEDLALKPSQLVTVTRKINDDWLYGESSGKVGQFPSSFVDRIPLI